MKQRKNRQRHPDTLRTAERLKASREAAALAAQLQRRLGPERWAEAEAEWALLPDLDSCLPQQRLAWLLRLEARCSAWCASCNVAVEPEGALDADGIYDRCPRCGEDIDE